MKFRELKKEDWAEVTLIYKQGLETENASFQSEVSNWSNWNDEHIATCRIVAELNDKIIGWSALSPVSDRCIYGGVAEVSVYVASNNAGQKIGTELLNNLITESEENGIWTLQAGIFPENKASLRIHEKLNFRKVGYREKIGKLNGVWRDIVLLERRSKKMGID